MVFTKTRRIMIIDDDTRRIRHLCDLFIEMGHKVMHVTSVYNLKEALHAFKPDGIAIDLMMPTENLNLDDCSGGLETGICIYYSIIQPICPAVPFVIYSGGYFRGPDFIKNNKNFRGFISKSADPLKLIKALTD